MPTKAELEARIKELEATQCKCRRPEPVNENVVRAPRPVVQVATGIDMGLKHE